jgi:6-pyruvoyl-tetrahydropterin synthase
LQSQQEEQEIEKHQYMSELAHVKEQLREAKRKADDEIILQYEEQRKRTQKELENAQQLLVDAEAAQKRTENSKKKLQQEVNLVD